MVLPFEEVPILFEKQLQKLPIKEVSPIQRSKQQADGAQRRSKLSTRITDFAQILIFSTNESYNAPRSRNDVPDELIDAIFPWLCEYNCIGTSWLRMKKLFTSVAEVLAQDLPILFQKYPSHFLRFHPVFRTNVYCRHSRDVVSSTDALSNNRRQPIAIHCFEASRLFGRSGHKK